MNRSLRTMSTVLFAAALALAAAAPAGAKGSTCLVSGDKIVSHTHGVYVVKGEIVHDEGIDWKKGAVEYFACASAFGKRVALGVDGIHGGGDRDVNNITVNERYVAATQGSAGNAGYGHANYVVVADLKVGALATRVGVGAASSNFPPETQHTEFPSGVSKLLLTRAGVAGWISATFGPGWTFSQVMRAAPRAQSELLGEGTNISANFLRFDVDHNKLIWSTSVGTAVLAREKDPPKQGGSCKHKSGETQAFKSTGPMVRRLKFRRSNWRGGYQLIACSKVYHRRVVIGEFGVRRSQRFEPLFVQANTTTAAYVTRVTNVKSGFKYFTVNRVNLANGQSIEGSAGQNSLVGPTAFKLFKGGVIAWIVGPSINGPPTPRQVIVHDRLGWRIVATGETIDRFFLGFRSTGSTNGSVEWAVSTATG